MRYILATLVCVLLAVSAWASAPNPPSETPKPNVSQLSPSIGTILKNAAIQGSQKNEISIVGRNGDKNLCFKMGESLMLKATGIPATRIREELIKTASPKALTLYLDNVPMAGLMVNPSQGEAADDLLLSFNLTRNPYEDDNRKSWDTLLKRQVGYSKNIPVALAIGTGLPVKVQSDIRIYVATEVTICLILCICLAIFIVAFTGLVKHPTALRDARNGFYSLGKSQMAFWGLLVVLTFVGVWFVTGTMERIPPQVLILLGISGATGLTAKVIGENKDAVTEAENRKKITKINEELQKLETEKRENHNSLPQEKEKRLDEIKLQIEESKKQPHPDESAGFWQDICDDGNGLSFHRLQVVIWTIVLGMVFVWSVAQIMSMPEFPENLLILMGISNGTYLGFKIPEKS